MPGRQTTRPRPGPLADLAQPIGGAPVGSAIQASAAGSVGPSAESRPAPAAVRAGRAGTRGCARPGRPPTRGAPRRACAELPRQDAAAGDRQPPLAGGVATARVNTSSSRRATSSRQGMTPAPRAAAAKSPTSRVRPAAPSDGGSASPAARHRRRASAGRRPRVRPRWSAAPAPACRVMRAAPARCPRDSAGNHHQRSSSPAGLSVSSPARCT